MKKSICIILSILMLSTTTVMANETITEQASSKDITMYSDEDSTVDIIMPEESFGYAGAIGDLRWSLDSDGLLTISGNGDMPNFDYTYDIPWSDCCELIKKAVIKNGVTNICDWMFYGCSELTSITIPNSVTSIGLSAFYGCSELTSITIPNGVTSIGNCAFDGCSGLTSITMPNGITSIGDCVFSGCSGLTSITIPNGVTSIGWNSFFYCSGLTSITIPNSVTSIDLGAFYGCSGLTSISIPNSVTSIGESAFSACSSLTSITVEEDNPIYDSRNNCNAIIETSKNKLILGCKTTIIPNSVTGIGYDAFYCCSNLTSITIPNSVTSIGDYAFDSCSGLTSITIPNSVTSIGCDAFYDCYSLTDVYYQGTQEQWKAITFYNLDCFGDATIHFVGESSNLNSIGDVNLDGKINILDVTTIQKHLAQIVTLDSEALSLADTNADDKINILDATQIQKYLAHIIPEL